MIKFEPVYAPHLSLNAAGALTDRNFALWQRRLHGRRKSRQQIAREIRYRRTPHKVMHLRFLRKHRSYGPGPF